MRWLTAKRIAVLAVTLAAYVLSERPTHAQSNSIFGTQGPASRIGTNMAGSSTGLENNRTGPTMLGLDGNAITNTAQTGAANGSIVGRNDNTGRFVGDQRLEQFDQGGNAGRNTGRNATNFGNRAGVGNRNANARMGQNQASRGGQRTRPSIRPQQRIAFSYPVPPAEAINNALALRFRQIATVRTGLVGVVVNVDGDGIATITGTVDSDDKGRLAEMLVRLEPGVRRVQNQLTVVAR